jgi:hypothetical protein
MIMTQMSNYVCDVYRDVHCDMHCDMHSDSQIHIQG